MIQEGWRKVLHQTDDKKDEDQLLPVLLKDETGIVKQSRVKEGKTQPPKRYTEGQLITLMKTAGKIYFGRRITKYTKEDGRIRYRSYTSRDYYCIKRP